MKPPNLYDACQCYYHELRWCEGDGEGETRTMDDALAFELIQQGKASFRKSQHARERAKIKYMLDQLKCCEEL